MAQHWVWVTREDTWAKLQSEPLIPGVVSDGWTCDEGTRHGDAALLYRVGVKDFAYIFQAVGEPYEGPAFQKPGTEWWTEYRLIRELSSPIALAAARADDSLARSEPLLMDLHGTSFAVTPGEWDAFAALSSPADRRAFRALRGR